MKRSKLVTKFGATGTAQEGIERAIQKQAEIDEQKTLRESIEDNINKLEQAKGLREAERIGIFIKSSIYDALRKHKNMKKGDTISVVRRTPREPYGLVIITVDSKQELIPFLQRSYSEDFRITDVLEEKDQSKDWVQVDDRIAGKQYYIVNKQ